MNVLLFGSTGKVGSELAERLPKDGHKVYALTRGDGDLSNPFRADDAIQRYALVDKIACVINATAFNGLDACQAEPELAFTINSAVPAHIAVQCQKYDIPFIHFSTDYVFSGTQGESIAEDRPTKPWMIYGFTKKAGEDAALAFNLKTFIFRLSSVYGRTYGGPTDAVRWVREGKGTAAAPILVLHQFTAPTSTRLIADAIAHVLRYRNRWSPETYGIYNLATSEGVWKKEFSEYICRAALNGDYIIKEGSAVMPRPIKTVLNTAKFQRVFDYALPTPRADFNMTLPSLR